MSGNKTNRKLTERTPSPSDADDRPDDLLGGLDDDFADADADNNFAHDPAPSATSSDLPDNLPGDMPAYMNEQVPDDAEPAGAPSRSTAAPTTGVSDGKKLSISERALRTAGSPAAASYMEGLNPEQRQAVETLDGPVLVLAGAGTGKTRVLTTRIAHILASNRAYPSQVLAVTFTNKAAREMKERIGKLIGGAVEGMPWLGTFHAIGVKILRRHSELVGLKSGFTILDTDDQIRLLKQVIEAEGLDKDRWPARQLANLIDSWKNRGHTPDMVAAGESFSFGNGKGQKLYGDYQQRLKDLNACDFGDLLLECLRLFRNHPDVLADYHRRFKYILVDEYQDTNTAQYLWLRLLTQGSPNVCCVGDDDQSIYGWRGAEVDNILRFDRDFPGATVVRLERNYRSTGNILATAAGLIAKNKDRLGKTLFTDGAKGSEVTITGVWDDEEEARVIGSDIENLRSKSHALNEIAILVRASAQMRAIEDRFITLGLPYRVIGGPRFYERQEIRDAIAYLEVVANPSNDLKFERIINVPKRGLGDTSVKRVVTMARARGMPTYFAAREIVETEELGGKARKSLSDLVASFDRWRSQIDTLKHTELAELILDESGYTGMWQADKSPQAQSRLENLKELIRFMDQFDTLAGFMEHVSLVMDTEQGDDGDRVSLMTLHAAKGLEFGTVFLSGWEEGLFPHQRALDESGLAGLEEERRLAYVGITRGKKNVHISFAQNRRMRGLYQAATPSRFIDELPEDSVAVIESKSPYGGAHQSFGGAGAFGGQGAFGRTNPYGKSRFDEDASPYKSTYETPGWQRAQSNWKSEAAGSGNLGSSAGWKGKSEAAAAKRRSTPLQIEGELVASSSAEGAGFAVGDRITHQKFGGGSVTDVDGNKLTIEFDTAGRKRVVDSFVERE